MLIDRLRAFTGNPQILDNGIKIYSPTIQEISDIGEMEYSLRLSLSSFDPSKIFTLFGIDTKLIELNNMSDYEAVIGVHPVIINAICESLELFTKEKVIYNDTRFFCNNVEFINNDNYKQITSLIFELNGIKNEDSNSLKFKNNRAKELFEKMNNILKQKAEKTDDGLDLKDVLSILCNAEGNGLNIFNVAQLTVYQMYEQFERLNLKENHKRLLPVWANGHLKESDKLPEWIVKQKL